MQNLVFMGVALLVIAWVCYLTWYMSTYGGTHERTFHDIEDYVNKHRER